MDLQLKLANGDYAFASMRGSKKRGVFFQVEIVRWNTKTLENDTLNMFIFSLPEFSAWMKKNNPTFCSE